MECNSLWKPEVHLPRLDGEEVVLLILCIVVIIAVVHGVNRILKYATMEWGCEISGNGGDKLTTIELNFGVAKVIMLLGLLVSLWFPVLPDCQDHTEGVFEQKYFFIAQLLESTFMTGLFYCIYPLLLLLLDLNRIRYMTMRFIVCRPAHTCVSVIAAFFAIVPLALFTYQSSYLHRQEMEVKYCKLRAQWIRIVLNSIVYVIYIGVVLAQEGAVFMFTKQSSEEDDETALNSTEQLIFNESIREQLDTAKSNTIVEKEDALRVTPRPFVIDNSGEGVLSLENRHNHEWLTVRVLISAPNSYRIHPQKLIIPPQRSSTISVQLRTDVDMSSSREAGLMLQWFSVGTNCPHFDVNRLWQRPYIMPRNFWHFYVLPIFHESQEVSMDTAEQASADD